MSAVAKRSTGPSSVAQPGASVTTPATPVRDTAASHLRNALQVISGVIQDELEIRSIGYTIEGQQCLAITVEELEAIHTRVGKAVQELEREATERAGVLKQLMERA